MFNNKLKSREVSKYFLIGYTNRETTHNITKSELTLQKTKCEDDVQHPTFQDFEFAASYPRCIFPYKSVVFNGNNSDVIAKIARPRGFTRVLLILPLKF